VNDTGPFERALMPTSGGISARSNGPVSFTMRRAAAVSKICLE